MTVSLRQSEILNIARHEGKVLVEDLAARFHVTLQTIRKDLGELDAMGHLARVHGGAVLKSGVANIGYETRRDLMAETKTRIAEAAAREIPENTTLFLNIGTTTEAVARALCLHRDITVITNNMNIANILVDNPGCNIFVAGGALRRSDGGLVGDLTTEAIQRFKPDIAVIGASAIDSDGDLLDFDPQEVHVSRRIIERARKVMCVADHSKFSRTAPAHIAALADIDILVTDCLPEGLKRKTANWPTRIIETNAP